MTGSDVSWEYITTQQVPEYQSLLFKEDEPHVYTLTHTMENLPLKGTRRVTHQLVGEGSWTCTLRHQTALGYRPSLYQMLVLAPAFLRALC